ncbi:MAG: oligogalacturonate lyase family protein [FCB group bacterium]|jgi:Tol biopolymer transport system component|nr:oligogalacturonate lyase family protein [FCB group bacterium]
MQNRFPSERSTYADPRTGAEVVQWTHGPHKNQHLYFTSPSVTADDRWLVFLSDRDGNPNLYVIDRRDGTIRRLSRNDHGLLRSYVYPQGGLQGLSKASPCLDPHRNRLYYIRDDTVMVVALDAAEPVEQTVCKMPPLWYGAFTHVSPDGKTLCVPCTDPRAFVDEVDMQWEQMRKVPGRMEREHLTTRLYLIDVQTGTLRLSVAVPFWVTHVQFDPKGTGRIIFNREGFAELTGGVSFNRIWCLELDGTFRPLSPEPPGEWRAHENWALDGNSIVYHGGRDGQAFVASRTWDGRLLQETHLGGIEFWHATAALDGRRMVVDRPDGLISIVDPGADRNRLVDLCRHDSSVEDQDAHPHPITTPSGGGVIFTSVRTGHCQVYEVLL